MSQHPDHPQPRKNGSSNHQPEIHRLLPQAPEAERGVLGSFLLAPREIGGWCAERGVTPEHFHLPAHAVLYQTLMEFWEGNRAIDFITLTGALRDRAQLEEAGGSAYVTELFTYLPTTANARYYLDALQEKFTLREIIKVCTQFAAHGYEAPQEAAGAAGLLDEVEGRILAIRRGDDAELKEKDPRDLILTVVNELESHYDRPGEITGLATGFPELDQTTDGLHPGEMIVIAARPSVGKTALAMTIAEHVAIHEKKTVAVFTLEMTDKELMKRALLSRARVNLHRARMGLSAERDFPALTAAARQLADRKLRIVDAIGATIGAIRAKARRMARRHSDLALIVVDYLQLIRGMSKQAQANREREIGEVSAGLKSLAKELNLPVLVLAQLNRDVEKRTGDSRGRPRLSDLRESGTIEQDADLVGLLYRDECYAETEFEKREVEGKATLIIAKQRNGPIGDIDLTFLKEYARYESRAGAGAA